MLEGAEKPATAVWHNYSVIPYNSESLQFTVAFAFSHYTNCNMGFAKSIPAQ